MSARNERIHDLSESNAKAAWNVLSWVLNGAMGCDEVRWVQWVLSADDTHLEVR